MSRHRGLRCIERLCAAKQCPGRHIAQRSLRCGRDLSDGVGNVRAGLEVNFHLRPAIPGLRIDVSYVTDRRRQTAFGGINNTLRHFLRRHAAEIPEDADDRDVNIWKNVCRGAHYR